MPAADLQFLLLGPKIPCHNQSAIEIVAAKDESSTGNRRGRGQTKRRNGNRRRAKKRGRKRRRKPRKRWNDSTMASNVFFGLTLLTQVACPAKLRIAPEFSSVQSDFQELDTMSGLHHELVRKVSDTIDSSPDLFASYLARPFALSRHFSVDFLDGRFTGGRAFPLVACGNA